MKLIITMVTLVAAFASAQVVTQKPTNSNCPMRKSGPIWEATQLPAVRVANAALDEHGTKQRAGAKTTSQGR